MGRRRVRKPSQSRHLSPCLCPKLPDQSYTSWEGRFSLLSRTLFLRAAGHPPQTEYHQSKTEVRLADSNLPAPSNPSLTTKSSRSKALLQSATLRLLTELDTCMLTALHHGNSRVIMLERLQPQCTKLATAEKFKDLPALHNRGMN
jgi:hypothetical protein